MSANLQNILQPVITHKTLAVNNPKPMKISGQYSHKEIKTPYNPINPIKPENPIKLIPSKAPRKNKLILIYFIRTKIE